MPVAEEIRKGTEIGYKSQRKHIWTACKVCGKYRWVQMVKEKLRSKLCRSCDGKRRMGTKGFQQIGNKHPNWKGGKTITATGYILVRLFPDDFFYPMARQSGYVSEHRLVIAKYLGRCLQSWEIVHHRGINYPQGSKENRSDNSLGNLEIGTQHNHMIEHDKGYKDGYQKGLIDGRVKQIEELKTQNNELLKQIKLCQWQIKELGIKEEVKNESRKIG